MNETMIALTVMYFIAMVGGMSSKNEDVFLISVLFCAMIAFPLIQLLGKIQ